MDSELPPEEGFRALTLTNLLILMTFTITVASVFMPMKEAGVGALRFLVGAIPALCLGATLVWVEWVSLRYIFDRLHKLSKGWQTVLNLGALLFMVLWLVVGGIAGVKLGSLLTRFVV
jgi:uncharacterized membrane protein